MTGSREGTSYIDGEPNSFSHDHNDPRVPLNFDTALLQDVCKLRSCITSVVPKSGIPTGDLGGFIAPRDGKYLWIFILSIEAQ